MNRIRRFFMRAPIGLRRVGLGGLLGQRMLLLEHIGRTSGIVRRTVLEVVEIQDGGVPVVVSGDHLRIGCRSTLQSSESRCPHWGCGFVKQPRAGVAV